MSDVAPHFGDHVRIRTTPLTTCLGLAGLTGTVYGETTPSVTEVEVIGDVTDDFALNVMIEQRRESFWFAPDLVEFIDHAAGTEIVIGSRRFVRDKGGEWIEKPKTSLTRSICFRSLAGLLAIGCGVVALDATMAVEEAFLTGLLGVAFLLYALLGEHPVVYRVLGVRNKQKK